jgi:hypothetical protein
MSEMLTVHWCCGHYVGPAKWHRSSDWVLEPDECPGEGTFEIPRQDWKDMAFGMHCTKCGAEMGEGFGHFRLDDGTSDQDL